MRVSPEGQFISNILGLSLKSKNSPIGETISPMGQINWDTFIQLVNHHRVGGVLFYWIRELNIENSFPRDVLRDLEGINEYAASIWEDHQEILKRILMQFHESEVEVILLKGAQLAHSDYPEFYLRPIEDIDLLLRKSNRSRVIKFMLEMGFNLYETNQTCDKFFIKKIWKWGKKRAYQPIFIEVHSSLQTPVRLNRSFSIDIDEFWDSTQERDIAGFPFLQLSLMYNLIYLSAHLGHHHFGRLIWIYDIALLIHRHREEIDWEKLRDLCGRMRIRTPLYHSLTLCRDFFQISIPKKVLKDLAPSLWRKKMGEFLMRRNLLFPQQPRVSRFSQFLTKMFLVDNWMEAILWFLFPTREWIKQQYSVQGIHEIYPYYLFHSILYLIKAIKTPMK